MQDHAGGTLPKRARILVVDDHPDSARMLARMLAIRGYAAVPVSCADEAVRTAAGAPFDLMICDISMPVYNGWELLQRIQRERPIQGIAVSGHAGEVEVQRSIDAGFRAHLSKPIDVELLYAEIEKVMGEETTAV